MHRYLQNRVVGCLKMLLIFTDVVCLNIAFMIAITFVNSNGLVDAQEVISTNFYSLWITFTRTVRSSVWKTFFAPHSERLC